jgi:hypothetical protein
MLFTKRWVWQFWIYGTLVSNFLSSELKLVSKSRWNQTMSQLRQFRHWLLTVETHVPSHLSSYEGWRGMRIVFFSNFPHLSTANHHFTTAPYLSTSISASKGVQQPALTRQRIITSLSYGLHLWPVIWLVTEQGTQALRNNPFNSSTSHYHTYVQQFDTQPL